MGWNYINSLKNDKILKVLIWNFKFILFIHIMLSLLMKVFISKNRLYYKFDSIINRKNIYGVQFHREKSHKFGIKLLKNFVLL